MPSTYDVKQELLAAFRSVMTPLVRILLRNDITFREFTEVIKEIFVSVGARELAASRRRVSAARIAITSGLTRREVSTIVRDEGLRRRARETNTTKAARLLEGWHSEGKFIGPYGFPRDLLIEGNDPGGTFTSLVRQHCGDVPVREMLDELLRVGAAELIEGGTVVRVLKRTYIPTDMTPEMMQIFTQAVRRYIETVDYNLSLRNTSARRFERLVYPDFGVRQRDYAAFQKEICDYLETVIAEIDFKSTKYQESDGDEEEERLKVGVGIYFYRDEPEDKRSVAQVVAQSIVDLND